MTGDADCCARAESGHAVTVPPRSLMNSRRVIASPEACDKAIVAVQTRPSKGQTMSALGQKQTYAPQQAMSALPQIATEKADFRKRSCLLYPRKRTCAAHTLMSALGQKRTSPHHSIVSSARVSTAGGMMRPNALAVLRLITSSYLVGACTGRSAGFSPLRMRST